MVIMWRTILGRDTDTRIKPDSGQREHSYSTMEEEDEMMKAMGIESFGKRKKENKTITGHDEDMRPMVSKVSINQSVYSFQSIIQPSTSIDGLGQRYSDTPSVKLPTSVQVTATVSDDEEDEYGSEQDLPLFPNQLTATLKQHKKVVSALAIDPSGARFATGAHDYDVKLWDFGGMGGGVGKAFKSFEPAENYYVSFPSLFWHIREHGGDLNDDLL